MEEYAPHYAQLVGIGILWVTFHCSGMCGPLIASLVGTPTTGESNAGSLWVPIRRVLAYQGGRAITYAVLGAVAGLVGVAAESVVTQVSQVAGLVLAVAIFGAGLAKMPGLADKFGLTESSRAAASGQFLGRMLARIKPMLPNQGMLRLALMGLVMGFLPCMLMFWVLGISAATASPLHGATIMVGLVIMTTPVLLVAGCAPMAGRGVAGKLGAWLIPSAMILSSIWLGLISAAANGWIAHLHWMFELGGETFTIMFW